MGSSSPLSLVRVQPEPTLLCNNIVIRQQRQSRHQKTGLFLFLLTLVLSMQLRFCNKQHLAVIN